METKFNKQETIKLIEEYYQKLEGRSVKASISAKKTTIGLYEDLGCQTTVSIEEEMEIAGIKKEVKITLSKDTLRQNLKALFALYGLDLKGLDYDDGLSSRCEGYGMMEHTTSSAYFNGITVRVEKVQSKSLGMYYR